MKFATQYWVCPENSPGPTDAAIQLNQLSVLTENGLVKDGRHDYRSIRGTDYANIEDVKDPWAC